MIKKLLTLLIFLPLVCFATSTDKFIKVSGASLNKSLFTAIDDGSIATKTSLDQLFNVSASTAQADDIIMFNGSEWVNRPFVTPMGGSAVTFYYDDAASDIGGYNILEKFPSGGTEVIDSGTVNSGTSPVLIESYASASTGLGVASIPAGVWQFSTYAYVSSATGVSSLTISVYKRTSGGTETLLFTHSTGEINNTSVAEFETQAVQGSFSVNTTDRLVIKFYAVTDSAVNRTVSFTHNGTDHYSHVHSPLGTTHNDLSSLQGGASNQYYHLSSSEYTGTGTGDFVRKTSPTFATGLNTPKVDLQGSTYVTTIKGSNSATESYNIIAPTAKPTANNQAWTHNTDGTSQFETITAGDAVMYMPSQYTLTVTGTSWSTERAVGVVYKTLDGAYRMAFNIAGNTSSGTRTDYDLSISNVTSKNTAGQAVSCQVTNGSASIQCFAAINANSGTIRVSNTSQTTQYYRVSGDIELNAAPSFYTDDTSTIVDNVRSKGTTGGKPVSYAAHIRCATGTCSIDRTRGDWLSAATDTGVGEATLTVKSGIFSAKPICNMIGSYDLVFGRINESALSTTNIRVDTYNSSLNQTDSDFLIMCEGYE